jgi:G patch domain-containing protein 1
MTTFKPVFVPRAERETQTRKDKRDGRGKDGKKRAKAIVSFEDDDGDDGDEGAALVIAPHLAVVAADKDKARKKKKRRKEEEDVGMWVEKEPPQVVASFASTATVAPLPLPRQPSAKEESWIEAPVVPSTSSNAEYSGPINIIVNTCYKCFHGHTRLSSLRKKWLFENLYQIRVKTVSA